jgi:hypothetical protein
MIFFTYNTAFPYFFSRIFRLYTGFLRIFAYDYRLMEYESFQLDNGIRVVHHRVPGMIAHAGLIINP